MPAAAHPSDTARSFAKGISRAPNLNPLRRAPRRRSIAASDRLEYDPERLADQETADDDGGDEDDC